MLSRLAMAIVLTASAAIPQCTTPFNYVNCNHCPRPSLYMCWDGSNQYSVFGTIVEVWCNYTPHSGWCSTYPSCTTVSVMTRSRDCNGNDYATPASICCVEP
jgi:hypothetical protein